MLNVHSAIIVFRSLCLWMVMVSLLVSCGPRQPGEIAQVSVSDATNQVVDVPGTHCSIVPPKGFTPASSYTGLAGPDDAMITIMDLAGGNFYKNAATFSRQTFEDNGISVFDYQETSIDGYPARYVIMRYDDDISTFSMVFGDTTFCVIVSGMFSATSEVEEQQLKESFMSMTYDKARIVDPMAVANFTVDANEPNFKFKHYSGGTYTYMLESARINKDLYNSNAAFVFITSMPYAEDGNLSDFIKQRIEKHSLSNAVIKKESSEDINGYQAYQLEVQGTTKEKPTLIYIVQLNNGKKTIILECMAMNNFEKRITDFDKFVRAVKIKP